MYRVPRVGQTVSGGDLNARYTFLSLTTGCGKRSDNSVILSPPTLKLACLVCGPELAQCGNDTSGQQQNNDKEQRSVDHQVIAAHAVLYGKVLLGRLQEQGTQDGAANRPQAAQKSHQRKCHVKAGIEGSVRIDRQNIISPNGPDHADNERGNDKSSQFVRDTLYPQTH